MTRRSTMRPFYAAVLALVLAPAAVVGQVVPKAALTGPAVVAKGTMAIIKTEGSTGKNFRWLVLPKTAEAWFLAVFVDAGAGKQERAGILVPAGDGPIYVSLIATAGDVSDVVTLVVNAEDAPTPTPDPKPQPDTNPYTPSATYKPLMGPILAVRTQRADAVKLSALYSQIGTEAAAGAIQTTADLRTALVTRGKPLGIKGKYVGLAAAVESALNSALGVEVEVARINTEEISGLMDTLAWAIWEASK